MSRARPAAFATATAIAAAALVGCGSSGSSTSQRNGARLQTSIAISATLTITGRVTASGGFLDDISSAAVASSCDQAAAGFTEDGQRYALPQTPTGTRIQGHDVRLTVYAGSYTGPGTYGADHLHADDGSQTLIILDNVQYAAVGSGASATLTVRPDGSGSLAFQNLQVPPPPAASPAPGQTPAPSRSPLSAAAVPPITGLVQWTCALRIPAGATPPASPSTIASAASTGAAGTPSP